MGMSVGSLFCGIGGIDLGLERVGMEVRWQVELDEFCNRVLAKHWADVVRFRDVREVGAHNLEPVDLIAGGFPCQGVSVAGKGAGLDDERSGLWFEYLRVVQELRPRWVLVENVPALRTRGSDTVLDGLGAAGYAAWPLVVGARHVGAPHRRDRVWIVAWAGHRNRAGKDTSTGLADANGRGHHGRAQEAVGESERRTAAEWAGGVVDDAAARRCWRSHDTLQPGRHGLVRDDRWPARPGERQHEWEEPRTVEPPLGQSTTRLPGRLVGLTGELHATSKNAGAAETVCLVWHPYETQADQRETRGHGSLLPAEVLRENLLLRWQGDADAELGDATQPSASRGSIARLVRDVWLAHPAQPTSRQRESGRQPTRECPDPLCALPYAVALDEREARDLQRAAGRHRRAALKALGNSVVPQVVELIGRAILAAEKRGE